MKNERSMLGTIFLGKRDGTLAHRFEIHLLTMIPLLLISAIGRAMEHVAELRTKNGGSPSLFETGAIVAGHGFGTAAFSIGAYVVLIGWIIHIVDRAKAARTEDTASAA